MQYIPKGGKRQAPPHLCSSRGELKGAQNTQRRSNNAAPPKGEKQHHPKTRREDSSTNAKRAERSSTTTREGREGKQLQPKEGRTQPSLGGDAFPCSFWAVLFFPPLLPWSVAAVPLLL